MKYLLFCLITALSFNVFAQLENGEKKVMTSETGEYVLIKYKWKANKEGKYEVRVKFKNKAKSAVNVDAELGFYDNGVLKEKAMLNDCLKKSFFDNWFRPVHIIITESFTKEELLSESTKVEVLEFKTELVDECRETDSK